MFGRCAHIICTLTLLAGDPSLVGAQAADGPDYWAVTGVRSNDVLNLRMAPSADSEAILRIPYNARGLKNYGCPNDVTFEQWKRMSEAQRDRAARSRWCQVEYQGRKGWVAGRFLREDGGTAR
jgi:SH3-like domain-containing protein